MDMSLRTLRSKNAVNRDQLVPCPFCHRDIAPAHVARHLVTHIDTKQYKCSQCEKGFSKFSQLNRHLTTHSEIRPMIPCTFCSKSYISDHGLRKHIKKVHSRKRLRGSHSSSATAVVVNQIKEEQQPVAEVKTEKQDEEMEIISNQQTTLKNTTAPMGLKNDPTVTGASKLKLCPICNQCIGKYGLSYHMLVHRKSVMNPHRCPQCKIGFAKPSRLAKHIKKVHEGNNSCELVANECAVCKNKYSSKRELKFHNCRTDITVAGNTSCTSQVTTQARSENHPTFKCDICEKMYRTTTGLEFHRLKVHKKEVIQEQTSVEPPPAALFKCEKCHKEFNTKKCYHTCIEESSVAQVKKRFQCAICKKVYSTRKALDGHNSKLHGIIKVVNRKHPPIKCDNCHKEFKSRRYLRTRHVCRGLEKAPPVATTPINSKFICIRYL